MNKEKIKIIPLGGLEQIGMNMTAFEYGDSIVVLDCGLAFPEDDMLGIDFGNHHRYILRPSVSRVVGNNRALELSDLLFQSTDLVLLHIYSAESEVDLLAIFFDIVCTVNYHLLYEFRARYIKLPSSLYCLFVSLTGRSRRCA